MIHLNYDVRIVLVLFAQANPGKLNPSVDDIQDFDRELAEAAEATLRKTMVRFGIPLDVSNKSQILAYQPNMPGTTLTMQIQNACTFFQNTTGVVEDPPPPDA